MFRVTGDWVKAFSTRGGGWNRAQLECLGVKWPPRHGWLLKLIGTEITEQDKAKFEQLQGQTLKLKRINAGQSPQAKSKVEYRRELLDWYKQMVTVAARLSPEARSELEAWEQLNLNGHSIGTTDWPGWQRYMPPRPSR